MFMSKFQGRRLTLPDFKEALFQFFHSGRRLQRELLSPVLRKLRDMQAALESCESYRFYSSSLLIIYDGATAPLVHQQPENSHMCHDEGDDEDQEDEDECEQDNQAEPEMDEAEEAGQLEGAFSFANGSSSEGGSGKSGESQVLCGSSSEPMVDVRMIDFAHTTCRHFQGDSVVYEGLDSGYLFGLQNLITIISELENSSEP